MADNFGVLGGATGIAIGTNTVYVCPANRAAKIKLFGQFQGGAASTIDILVNEIRVASVPAMTAGFWTFTNGGAGLLRAPAATTPTGQSAAETAQPAAAIFYLSAGQTVKYTVGGLALQQANLQVVGVEVDLTQ